MFGQRKNKTFTYKSRFDKDNDSASQLKETMKSSWNEARPSVSGRKKSNTLFLLIGLLVFIAILMYYLDTKIK